MRKIINTLVFSGVVPEQTHASQRRIKATNVIASIAFALTVVFFAAFLVSGRTFIGESSYIVFVGGTALFLGGYVFAIRLNGRGHHAAAAAAALTTGMLNIVVSVFVVGFTTGPAVFLIMICVAAILVTGPDTRVLRWTFIIAPAIVFGALAIIDPPVSDAVADTNLEALVAWLNYLGLAVFASAAVWYQQDLADTAEAEMVEANERSDVLLLNILPASIAERLKDGEKPIADRIEHVAVLFGDIVGSTPLAERLSANELVEVLDGIFSLFDTMAENRGLEKIKTIGDAYMVVGGLDASVTSPDATVADMALAMRDVLTDYGIPGGGRLQMRFGMASGPVVAGVIGSRKFSYDLWGDTVNTAARMESHGVPGKIQVTESVRNSLDATHRFSDAQAIDVRGKGGMHTYFLIEQITASHV